MFSHEIEINFSEKEMKTSKRKEGTHSSSSESYPVTYFSNSKNINLKRIKTSSTTPSLKHGALKHIQTQLHSLFSGNLSTGVKQRLILCLKCILNRQGV